jgi:hypothetical protein
MKAHLVAFLATICSLDEMQKVLILKGKNGAATQDRTVDLLITNEVLYH